MSDTNIDKFNDLAGKIFAELYEHFPIPYDLVAKKLATPTFTSEGNDLCLLELPDRRNMPRHPSFGSRLDLKRPGSPEINAALPHPRAFNSPAPGRNHERRQ